MVVCSTVGRMTDHQPLPDRWSSRDFRVLLAAARRLDGGETHLQVRPLVSDTGLDEGEIIAALQALLDVYIVGKPLGSLQGTIDFLVTGLTERGRRAGGLWPSGESADALIDALRHAEELTDDPEEKSLLRRAGGAVGSVSRDIMVDVVAAVVARQSGVG